MTRLLRGGKLAFLTLARMSGFGALVLRSSWRRNRLPILCYHGTSIDDEHVWNPRYYVTQERLLRRMELIRDAGCRVLPLDEAIRRLHEGALPPRSVVLTFDDGTYDFYSRAYPVLKSFDYPITVYLPTYYSEYTRPVYDLMCDYLLWKGGGRAISWPEVFGSDAAVPTVGAGLEFVLRRVRDYPVENSLRGAEKDDLLCRLAALLKIDFGPILEKRLLHQMNSDEVRELAARGVDFQLHTHRHRVSLNRDLFEREIADNRERLAQFGAGGAAHFCYPGGVHRPEFPAWLAACGIRSATTCTSGIAARSSNPLLLPRFLDSDSKGEDEFIGWLTGVAALLPHRRFVETEGQFMEGSDDPAESETDGLEPSASPRPYSTR